TDNSARVSVTTSEHGAAVIEVYNSIGMLVQSMVVPADGTSASGTILDGRYAAGLYTVLVRTQQQTAHSHVLKR
ncbi:MAG: T9SS type A sorting domain-containing protein, partial [Candidatus Kapaibacterium sp.]